MERSALRRMTVDADSAFVCKQCWLHAPGDIWWDLDYLHKELGILGMKSQKKQMVASFSAIAADASCLGWGALAVYGFARLAANLFIGKHLHQHHTGLFLLVDS